jgi:hypothetical protein
LDAGRILIVARLTMISHTGEGETIGTSGRGREDGEDPRGILSARMLYDTKAPENCIKVCSAFSRNPIDNISATVSKGRRPLSHFPTHPRAPALFLWPILSQRMEPGTRRVGEAHAALQISFRRRPPSCSPRRSPVPGGAGSPAPWTFAPAPRSASPREPPRGRALGQRASATSPHLPQGC